MALLEGYYKRIKYRYNPHNKEKESDGILIINLPNGVESTHIIKGWGITRIFQYIASFKNIE